MNNNIKQFKIFNIPVLDLSGAILYPIQTHKANSRLVLLCEREAGNQ
jgi:hypothetical protein